MEKLIELTNIGNIKILHEGKTKDGNTMTILAPFIQADQKNKNGRIYPKSLLKREVERVQKSVESGSFIGSGDHGSSGYSSIADASHIIKKLWMDEDGRGMAELKIVPTLRGKSAMTLIKNGATLGLSTRGFGNVSKDGTVQDNFKLNGVDIVTNPSYEGGTFDKSNVFESVDFEKKMEKKTAPLGSKERQIELVLEMKFKEDVKEEGYQGTFEEWKRVNEAEIRLILAVSDENYELNNEDKMTKIKEAITKAVADVNDGKFSTIQEALTASGRGDLARGLRNERRKVTASDVAWEALGAGIDPAEFAKKINAAIDAEEAHEDTGWSKRERESILREVEQAGVDVSSAEKRVKILKDHKVIPDNDSYSLLEQEAKALYENLKSDGNHPNVTLESVRNMLLKEKEIKEKEELKQMKIQTHVREILIAGPAKKF